MKQLFKKINIIFSIYAFFMVTLVSGQENDINKKDASSWDVYKKQVFSGGVDSFSPLSENGINKTARNTRESQDLFDLIFQYEAAGYPAEYGIETDGNFIYTSLWSFNGFSKYTLDGTFIEEFYMDEVGGVKGMAYDGTYFYGATDTEVIYVLDLGAQTLVSSFVAPGIVRGIAYNEDEDVFYGNQWSSDIIVFNKEGELLNSFEIGPYGAEYSGLAYDNSSPGGPFLWGFAQIEESKNWIIQMQLPSGEETGIVFDVETVITNPFSSFAGGLYTSNNIIQGSSVLGGLVQNAVLWGLELVDNIPTYSQDVGVSSVIYPTSSVGLTSTEQVKVILKNYGTSSQSNIDVSFTLDGGTTITETYTGTLNAWEIVEYTFNSTVDLSEVTEYEINVCTGLNGDEDTGNDCFTKPFQNKDPYLCIPSYGVGCTWGDGIASMELEQISNLESGCGSTAGPSWGQYFELGAAELTVGETYILKIAPGYTNNNLSVWINFNDDFEFTIDERVIFNYALGEPGEVSNIEFEIPSSAALGEHVIRIRTTWSETVVNACGFYGYGEAEDYLVNISNDGYVPDPPENLVADVVNESDVILSWDPPGGPELTMLSQHDGSPSGYYYQKYNFGYGVVFDLSDYPNASLEHINFLHSYTGPTGIWDYKLHVVDWDTYTEVYVSEIIQTNDNVTWETDVSIGSIEGQSGLVGIFLEPMSNESDNAYPRLSLDDATEGLSYWGDLSDYSDMIFSGGDFIMDLWIQAGSQAAVKAPKMVERSTIKKESEPKQGEKMSIAVLSGYNIFRNGSLIESVGLEQLEYLDQDLMSGDYEYCVSAVYDEGESELVCADSITIDLSIGFYVNEITDVIVYPNPTSGIVSIKGFEEGSVTIFSSTGQAVMKIKNYQKEERIDLSQLEPGIYLIKLSNSNSILEKKIVIIK